MDELSKITADERVNEILEVIMSFARMQFDKKVEISSEHDVIDAIALGVNILGEELESSTISLKEKELLLKEIHHRVKNNLQIVSSLLNLQYENATDEKLIHMIRESKNRIHSMALVHEMLYSSKSLSDVNCKEYVQKLFTSIYHSFQMDTLEVKLLLSMSDQICFDVDKMIPLGLILNEIMTNSLKYAFPDHKGEIHITLSEEGEKLTLTVHDNGIGLPADFNHLKAKSLGIQLIFILADQIAAEVTLDRQKGTSYSFHFE